MSARWLVRHPAVAVCGSVLLHGGLLIAMGLEPRSIRQEQSLVAVELTMELTSDEVVEPAEVKPGPMSASAFGASETQPQPVVRAASSTRRSSRALTVAKVATSSEGGVAAAAPVADAVAGVPSNGIEGDENGRRDAVGTAGMGPAVAAGVAETRASRSARLRSAVGVCSGLFPWAAEVERGVVTVDMDVASSGRVIGHDVVRESPSGQGFALAAETCIRRLVFEPGRTASGGATASHAKVQLVFERI